ncbi:hypothetical protein BamIOP4010DRAFT_4367 [Burkholderia ambifaria IOP40-10]|uniref:Uncharacterized protein n=1 Tax=Burkholderia ambifaria IOP40-10 TaxID=396596 RepID=B1FK06_9BURK|nr:hypothetical protein BamIOP4010DRAFT_4367 [Burkholderia ambifaria IOP40-10]
MQGQLRRSESPQWGCSQGFSLFLPLQDFNYVRSAHIGHCARVRRAVRQKPLVQRANGDAQARCELRPRHAQPIHRNAQQFLLGKCREILLRRRAFLYRSNPLPHLISPSGITINCLRTSSRSVIARRRAFFGTFGYGPHDRGGTGPAVTERSQSGARGRAGGIYPTRMQTVPVTKAPGEQVWREPVEQALAMHGRCPCSGANADRGTSLPSADVCRESKIRVMLVADNIQYISSNGRTDSLAVGTDRGL